MPNAKKWGVWTIIGLIAIGQEADGYLTTYKTIDTTYAPAAWCPPGEPWFDCSCCPTNLCRFMPSVPGYIYAHAKEKVYVNLFIQSATEINIDGTSVNLNQQTGYPWNGAVKIEVSPEKDAEFSLCLRIPGWANNQPVPGDLYHYQNTGEEQVSLRVNGKPVEVVSEDGYAVLTREWKKGDVVEYALPMEIRKVKANELVEDDKGKVAIERGPVVYCIEGVDNPAFDQLRSRPAQSLPLHLTRICSMGWKLFLHRGNRPVNNSRPYPILPGITVEQTT